MNKPLDGKPIIGNTRFVKEVSLHPAPNPVEPVVESAVKMSVNDVRFVCASPPVADDPNVQGAFLCLQKRQGECVRVKTVAEEMGVEKKVAREALETLIRNESTCVVVFVGDDERTYFKLPNVFFKRNGDGMALCIVGHVLTADERDGLLRKADDLMTNARVEFAGDSAKDEEEDEPRPPSRSRKRAAYSSPAVDRLRKTFLEYVRERGGLD